MCGQFGLGFRAGIYDDLWGLSRGWYFAADVRQSSLKMCIAHIKSMCLSLVSWACNPGGVLKKGVRRQRKTKQEWDGMRVSSVRSSQVLQYLVEELMWSYERLTAASFLTLHCTSVSPSQSCFTFAVSGSKLAQHFALRCTGGILFLVLNVRAPRTRAEEIKRCENNWKYMKHWNFCVFYDWYWMILKSATFARNVSRMWLTLATVQLHGIASSELVRE